MLDIVSESLLNGRWIEWLRRDKDQPQHLLAGIAHPGEDSVPSLACHPVARRLSVKIKLLRAGMKEIFAHAEESLRKTEGISERSGALKTKMAKRKREFICDRIIANTVV